jgi:CRISPR-associated protein Csb2
VLDKKIRPFVERKMLAPTDCGERVVVSGVQPFAQLPLRVLPVFCMRRFQAAATPAALPDSAARRRIDPDHQVGEAKSGQERAQESAKAGAAVVQALRHAGVSVRAEAIRVQREPFESNGERVETFAKGTRFSKHGLWHVEIEFAGNVAGPLVIGDGRFLGLGLFAPIPKRHLSDSSE